ncbi:MAG TPA: rhomboid family intramembrane serine protease [Tepidisphaeraceae bacterium]|nr:rhomboid family intramembrane serine protease [Tepidisphaeraceae bacterium]
MPSSFRIRYNAPVILTFSLAAAAVTIVAAASGKSGGRVLSLFFVPGHMDWDNPLAYVRLFTHVLGHDGWRHLMSNLMVILLIGPLLEEKYGSVQLLEMIAITAGVTGALNILLFDTALLGASGVAFMLIVLSSLTSYRRREIPLTFVLVAGLFVGGEIAAAMRNDNIAQFAHIAGGACGAMLGLTSERGSRG